ncbi:MAG: acetylglutamate kinase [Coriobacteriales bacterium]|jgi:acetylglutamate kinase
MEFERDRNNDTEKLEQLAQILIEALPWVKNATGKTVVIKYGGAAMVDHSLRASVMSDIVLLKLMGLNPIIVHGGGADINATLGKMGIEPKFVDGLRVTDEETMDVVKMVLIGKVNTELVGAMNRHGYIAVGMSGVDASTIIAEPYDEEHIYAGRVKSVDSTYIKDLLASDYIPVIASIATSEDRKTYYNINADAVAGEIAASIGAHKVVFLSDVDGLYLDFEDKGSLISRMTLTEAKEMLESGTLTKGMIPKMNAIVKALSEGVPRAHLLNGTVPHALLLEIFTNKGVGTMVARDKRLDGDDNGFETFPLANLAAKLQ